MTTDRDEVCTHIWTHHRHEEPGLWCRACGVKVHELETRTCGGCAQSAPTLGFTAIRLCSVHSTLVTAAMRVTFPIAAGSCYVPRVSPP